MVIDMIVGKLFPVTDYLAVMLHSVCHSRISGAEELILGKRLAAEKLVSPALAVQCVHQLGKLVIKGKYIFVLALFQVAYKGRYNCLAVTLVFVIYSMYKFPEFFVCKCFAVLMAADKKIHYYAQITSPLFFAYTSICFTL